MAAARVLIQFAHPALERSRVNRRLLDCVRDLPGVTVNDLYEEYPTLSIDVPREQALLQEHDVIVFQHPFYWYSVPSILKEWQDLVLEYGWAYGRNSRALAGKLTLNAITTGGPHESYARSGYNHFSVRELLAPWEQTARLCEMPFAAPFLVQDCLRITGDKAIEPYRNSYRTLIDALARRCVNVDVATAAAHLNDPKGELIQGLVTASPVGDSASIGEGNAHG